MIAEGTILPHAISAGSNMNSMTLQEGSTTRFCVAALLRLTLSGEYTTSSFPQRYEKKLVKFLRGAYLNLSKSQQQNCKKDVNSQRLPILISNA